jgi:uncharacterized membrane protein YcjF (UPF0283 family)
MWGLPPKTFWVLLVEGIVLFGLAVFAYILAFRLLLNEWGSLSWRGKVANAVFFMFVALLILLALIGFVIALSKEASVIWK